MTSDTVSQATSLALTMYRLSSWLKSPRPYLMLIGFAGFLSMMVFLGILVVGERLVRHWIAAHSVGGKVIGGTYRIVMFALLLVFCNVEQRPALIEVALAVMLITYAYEGLVTLHELQTGERPVR